MILPDVNVLVYAFRSEAVQHKDFKQWLDGVVSGAEAFAVTETVLSGFVRIVTNPRIFQQPDSVEDAFAFLDQILAQPQCVLVGPGIRHWEIFRNLCRDSGAKGNLIPDAFLAAIAIESGCEWITTDRDYSRFGGLKWRHPLAPIV